MPLHQPSLKGSPKYSHKLRENILSTRIMGRPKRNVLAVAEESLTPPDSLQPNQSVVRVVKPEGNNLYTCELPDKKTLLLELAQRFRNTIWVRRGGFVLAEQYPKESGESRAVGEIVNIVRDEKQWRKLPYWYAPHERISQPPPSNSAIGPRSSLEMRTTMRTTRTSARCHPATPKRSDSGSPRDLTSSSSSQVLHPPQPVSLPYDSPPRAQSTHCRQQDRASLLP